MAVARTIPGAVQGTSPRARLRLSEGWFALCLVLPTLLGIFVIVVFPLLYSLWLSFTDVNLLRTTGPALELFGVLSEELALEMTFEPGDIQLLNNHLMYHARTEFVDYPEPERKRLLLRLWLAVPGSRPLPDGYELVFGTTEAGAVRGGVASREGWRDVTQLRARRKKN
jgi:hypothetical protein